MYAWSVECCVRRITSSPPHTQVLLCCTVASFKLLGANIIVIAARCGCTEYNNNNNNDESRSACSSRPRCAEVQSNLRPTGGWATSLGANYLAARLNENDVNRTHNTTTHALKRIWCSHLNVDRSLNQNSEGLNFFLTCRQFFLGFSGKTWKKPEVLLQSLPFFLENCQLACPNPALKKILYELTKISNFNMNNLSNRLKIKINNAILYLPVFLIERRAHISFYCCNWCWLYQIFWIYPTIGTFKLHRST